MAAFKGGYFSVGHLGGVPIRVHWTAPIGAFFFSGMQFALAPILSFLFVVLIHELGHAAMVKLNRGRVVAVELTGIGGVCRWQGSASPVGRGVIAWGGVWAQLALATVLAVAWKYGAPGEFLSPYLVDRSLGLALFNLIPVPPFDGYEAWQLPYRWGQQVRGRLSGQAPKFVTVVEEVPPPDSDFGDRQPEVKALVDSLFEQARKEDGDS